MNETTRRIVQDSSFGLGDRTKRVAQAKPADPRKLTKTQALILLKYDGAIMGHTSKALCYDEGAPKSPLELSALVSLLKGGVMTVEEKDGPVPGAAPSRVGGQGPYHYVLRRAL